jgi:iron(III) transport system ATP-binding protein
MITVRNLDLRYASERGIVHAVRGIDIVVEEGQFYTLLGPSGCGKTTTLRSIAGLETPTGGEISIDGEVVFSAERNLLIPTHQRDIGMVFQSYAIWPHMSVFENVAFPLRERKGRFSRAQIADKVAQALAMVKLDGLQDRPAPFLSGGQQQRLALARSLVYEPKVLLLDEPLSNLDAKLREETRVELRDLVKRLGITTVYVTHDQLEALTMSDVIAVMNEGRIVQEASPLEIYKEPKDRFIATFIGSSNFLQARVVALPDANGLGDAQTSAGPLHCVIPANAAVGDEIVLAIRPEEILLPDEAALPARNVLEAHILSSVFMGDSIEAKAMVGENLIRLKLHPSTRIGEGDRVKVEIPALSCRALLS